MSKARDLANAGTALGAVTATELGYVDGVTSAIQTQINTKEATLPSQTGNSGKYLTTDGSAKSWGTVSQYALPSQTGNSGKYLTTNGTAESWGTVTAGGMTLLSTTTLSGASTAITGINQTYKNLYVRFFGLTAAAGYRPFISPNNDATISTWTGTFTAIYNSQDSTTIKYHDAPNGNNLKATDTNNVFSLFIDDYASTTHYKSFNTYGRFTAADTNAKFAMEIAGAIETNSAITSLTFGCSFSTFSSGTVQIYGVN